MHIGRVLKKIRKERKLTLRQVADKMGVTAPWLSMIENDLRDPTQKTIRTLTKVYKVSAAEIMWLSIEEKDIAESKMEIYKQLKPLVDDFMKSDLRKDQ